MIVGIIDMLVKR